MDKRIFILMIMVFSTISLSSCMESNPGINLDGANDPGHIHYSYTRYTGIQMGEIDAREGETIELTYTAGVIRGKLLMQVMSPDQAVLWDVVVDENVDENVAIPVMEDGTQTLIIRGVNTAGSYDVRWNVRE